MADGDAESIGGISVSVGASNRQLAADLAEANRLLEKWASQRFDVTLGANTAGLTPQGRGGGRGAAGGVPSGPVAPIQSQSAPPATVMPQLQREVLTLQRRALQRQATASTSSASVGYVEAARTSGLRRKNINARDIGTSADPGKVYTFDPEADDFKQRQAAAKATRQQEILLQSQARRAAQEEARSRPNQAMLDRQRAANNLNALGSNPPTPRLQSATIAGAPDQGRPLRDQIPTAAERRVAEDEAKRAARAQRAQAIEDAGGTLPPRKFEGGAGAPMDAIERQRQAALRDLKEFGRGRGGATGLNDEDYARRAEQRIATSESTSVARGRTARTTASGFGGQFLFGGPARQQAEAVARQTEAEQKLILARRRLNEPSVIRDANAYRHAVTEQTAAEENLATAEAKVKSLGGLGTAARSLAAVTVAGAAFSVGLQAIGFAVSAIGPAFGAAIDQATGFGAVSNKVTQGLAQQTLAAKGAVNAVLAQTEAQAGLSTQTADTINSQIKLTTQIKAGAQAAALGGGLSRAAIGANQQVPQGLLGGYGGIGGGAFLGSQLGGGTGLAETIQSTFGDYANGIAQAGTTDAQRAQNQTRDLTGAAGVAGLGAGIGAGIGGDIISGPASNQVTAEQQAKIAQLAKDRASYEGTLNSAAKRGAFLLGASADSVAKFVTITQTQADDLQKSNLPQELKNTAKDSLEALQAPSGELVKTFNQATDALKQIGVGLSVQDPAQQAIANLRQEQQRQIESAANVPAIQSQQTFVRQSTIDAIGNQMADALNRSLPANAAIANLAQPPVPVGTGIGGGKFSSAAEQKQINASFKERVDLQKQINLYYDQGQKVIEDTYRPSIVKNFGEATAQAFDQALADVTATGQKIAQIQAASSNEQAVQQTKEYNFQLYIARRNLSDIGGLTGKNFGAGQSYLGTLEKQNLALSRQGQLLQFALSQRQINFQTALAGFQAPGVTPEERQARIQEAKIEASFAQKQLNINKSQFQNQVKIVDIGNLRQGADLAKQIGLLVSGRQVTIDVQINNERVQKQLKLQAQQVAKVGTYTTAVDNFASNAIGEMQAVEAAFGHALEQGGKDAVLALYGFVTDFTSMLSGTYNPTAGSTKQRPHNAVGGVYNTTSRTSVGAAGIAGEAGSETLLILSRPRSANGGGMGVTNIINITGNSIRSDGDIDVLVRKVTAALGRSASVKGLRGVG